MRNSSKDEISDKFEIKRKGIKVTFMHEARSINQVCYILSRHDVSQLVCKLVGITCEIEIMPQGKLMCGIGIMIPFTSSDKCLLCCKMSVFVFEEKFAVGIIVIERWFVYS